MNKILILAFVYLLLVDVAEAGETPFPMGNKDDCMKGPMEQFGRYIGDWKIEDEQLAQDGSGWGSGKGARWIFACIGDGIGVQDYWFANQWAPNPCPHRFYER